MEVKPRKGVCKTCPWRKENAHQLTIDTIKDMYIRGVISPCHQELEKVTGSCTSGVEVYAEEVEVFQICRGYYDSVLGTVKEGMVGKDYIYKDEK